MKSTTKHGTAPAPDAVCAALRAAAGLLCVALASLGVILSAWVDLFGGVAVVMMALFGWRGFLRGGLRSLAALVAVLAIFAWAPLFGRLWAPGLQLTLGVPAVPARYVAMVAVAGLLLILGELGGVALARRYRRRNGVGSRRARGIGLMLGFGEGAMLGMTLTLIVVAVEPPARMALSLALEDTRARWTFDRLAWLRAHLHRGPVAQRLAELYEDAHEVLHLGGGLALLSRHPTGLERLKALPEVVDLMEHEPDIARAVREIKLDSALKHAVRKGDLDAILDSRTVLRLLDDRPLAKTLERHRGPLLLALLRAVPEGQRSSFEHDLARLHGMTPDRFRQFAARSGARQFLY